MSFGQRLFSLTPMLPGLYPALHDANIPTWKDGRNVVWRASGVQKMPGWSAIMSGSTGTANPIRGMVQQRVSGVQYLFYGDQTKLFKWYAGQTDAEDVSVAGGYSGNTDEATTHNATSWSFVPWGSYILATNGVDLPQSYQIGVSSDFANHDVGSQFTTAEIFIKRGPYVLALNTSAGSNVVHWCDTDDITDWTPTASNAAGNLVIRDLESQIMAATYLGDRIAVYGRDSMHILSYLGAPNYFGWQPALDGIGAVGKMAVVSVGRRNYGLSDYGFWETDGVSFNWIDDPAVRNWFMDRMNWAQKSKVAAYHDEENTQIIWYYPTTTGEPQEGLGFDYVRRCWSIYDHGRTSALERQVFLYPVAVTSGGAVYYHNFGQDADGSSLTAYVESKALDGDTIRRKFINEARTKVRDLSGTFNMKVATKADLDDATSWSSAYALDDGMEKVDLLHEGRFALLRFESTTTGAHWHLSGTDLYGQLLGYR